MWLGVWLTPAQLQLPGFGLAHKPRGQAGPRRHCRSLDLQGLRQLTRKDNRAIKDSIKNWASYPLYNSSLFSTILHWPFKVNALFTFQSASPKFFIERFFGWYLFYPLYYACMIMDDSNVNHGAFCPIPLRWKAEHCLFFTSHVMNEWMHGPNLIEKKVLERKKKNCALTHRALSPFTHAVDSRLVGAARLQTFTHMLLCWPWVNKLPRKAFKKNHNKFAK